MRPRPAGPPAPPPPAARSRYRRDCRCPPRARPWGFRCHGTRGRACDRRGSRHAGRSRRAPRRGRAPASLSGLARPSAPGRLRTRSARRRAPPRATTTEWMSGRGSPSCRVPSTLAARQGEGALESPPVTGHYRGTQATSNESGGHLQPIWCRIPASRVRFRLEGARPLRFRPCYQPPVAADAVRVAEDTRERVFIDRRWGLCGMGPT